MRFNRTLSTTLIFFFLLMFVQWSFSQGMMMATPAERAARLKERLSLSEEQTTKVQEIFENADKERREKMESLRGDREAMREQMTAMMTRTDAQIEKLLNDDQKKKYDDLKKERRQMRRGSRRPGGRAGVGQDSARSK